ncbi:SpaA isopeptide-forming pilin-related protein, partial [Ruminococcus bicirculans (ex Wegman et al. 2014)]|uniref:SpaA isopeptide-forming pilin-related protein n=1 Tax=Ruminococcus bicirculans (ex Wegman et al. 2014) TaxID=1160721 RepID=UPI003FD7D962
VRDTVNTAFENEYQSVRISLSKVMENDELFGIYGKDYYTNIRFGLFAAEDITAADGSVIPADGLISEVSLDENMTAKFDVQIPFGRYYVQEIATDEHYILNGEKYLVNFEYMGQDIQTVDIDCGQFVNLLKRGRIEGHKVDDKSEPLENAVFGLFTADCVKFSRDTAIMTFTSDENGYFVFDEIPYGEYIIHEIEAPTGYIFSDESYPVTVSEDGDVVEITAVNKPITIEISKVNVYGEELIGAEMQLIDSEDNVVDEWVSDGTNHVVSKLGAGEYVLKEIAAPDGYIIATDIKFNVDVYGNVTVENVDSKAVSDNGDPLITMVDDTTKVQISKQDITTGEELPGATLQIIDEDGNVVEEWVTTNEPHMIEGKLIAGKEYTLKEIIAPEGYEIANEIKFTVNDDGTVTEVVMYDELTSKTDTPYTGDNHSDFAAFAMLGAASVIIAILIITKKGKKHE